MHIIIPFEKQYQEAISNMMEGIQDEFGIPFRNPNGKQISDIVGPHDVFWIAFSNDRVVGTIGLSRIDDHCAFLRHLFVEKESRGKESGISQSLMDTARREAKKLNYRFIYLGTMEQFKAAQQFYFKNRFVCIPREALPAEMPVSVLDTVFFLLKLKTTA